MLGRGAPQFSHGALRRGGGSGRSDQARPLPLRYDGRVPVASHARVGLPAAPQSEPIVNLIDKIVMFQADMEQIRRDIHAHPELCFQETRTADVVAAKLTEWGIPIHRGMGKTGIVGTLKTGTGAH